MKSILYAMTCLSAVLFSVPTLADVFSLADDKNILYESGETFNEYLIYNKDKSCFLHYLSLTPPPPNWHIQITKQSDIKDVKCLEKGFASVDIKDNVGNLMQTLNGYFLDGFFIGNAPLNSRVLKRSASVDGVQNLFYAIDKDEELNIEYIGKMRAIPVNGVYTSFEVCPPFEVRLLTQNKDLFKDEETIQNLFTVVKSYAQTLCPSVKSIVFAATDSPSLSEKDIFFQEFLNKDPSTALWIQDKERSFNAVQSPKTKPIIKTTPVAAEVVAKTDINDVAEEPLTSESEKLVIHISPKTNRTVLFVDKPYIMKAFQTPQTAAMTSGWYRVEATLTDMDDLEKKRTGLSLNEPAVIINIQSARKCVSPECQKD